MRDKQTTFKPNKTTTDKIYILIKKKNNRKIPNYR